MYQGAALLLLHLRCTPVTTAGGLSSQLRVVQLWIEDDADTNTSSAGTIIVYSINLLGDDAVH